MTEPVLPAAPPSPEEALRPLAPLARWALAALATSLAAMQLLAASWLDSSYFVDELYFLAAAEHLDLAYVDMAPLMPALTALEVALFGNGLVATRLFVTAAGAALVFLAGWLAREMGGGASAQLLAALATLLAPIYLAASSYNSMNGYEPLLWLAIAAAFARLANGGPPRIWPLLGALAGLALLTKHTSLVLVVATLVALAVTPARRAFRERHLWIGGAIAGLLFAPNLFWMIRHDFPHLEVLRNIAHHRRDVVLSKWEFLGQQVAIAGPAGAILAAAGLAWLLSAPAARRFRPLAWTFVVALATFLAVEARVYYTSPLWAPLFAAGAVALERALRLDLHPRRRAMALAAVGLSGVALAPLAFPCLPPEIYVRYSRALGIAPPVLENPGLGALPQLHADRYGWRETAEAVAAAYATLSPAERADTAIFAYDYGRAGAIDRFGPELGLPKAISGHLTYFLWGPRGHSGAVVIVLGGDPAGLEAVYERVELWGFVDAAWAMPRSTVPIWICRGLRGALVDLWPQVREYS